MQETKELYHKTYDDLKKEYNYKDYFDEAVIYIDYIKNLSANENPSERLYNITGLSLDISDDDPREDELQTFIYNCNESIYNINDDDYSYPYEWQMFYLYKELFQFLVNKDYGYNYFRGQSNDYTLRPGIFRGNLNTSYRKDFETLYQKLSNEFPEMLEYIGRDDLNNIDKRACQLSLLQHYGLKTSLLDITSNPYIALLFMLSKKITEYKQPSIILFKIDEKYSGDDYLFNEVIKDKTNKRIIAQKGAFLNFDKLFFFNSLKKVPTVKIVLRFSDEDFLSRIDIERKMYKEIESIIKKRKKDDAHNKITNALLASLNNYDESTLENEEEKIEESKLECLKYIRDEMIKKLNEYFYNEEDLFPDFEKRIQYISRVYETTEVKKNVAADIKNKAK